MVDLDESAKIAHKSNTSNHQVKTLHLKSIQNKNIEHHFRIMLEDEKMFRIWQRPLIKVQKCYRSLKCCKYLHQNLNMHLSLEMYAVCASITTSF